MGLVTTTTFRKLRGDLCLKPLCKNRPPFEPEQEGSIKFLRRTAFVMRRAGNFHTSLRKRGFLAFGHWLMMCKDPNGLSIAQPNTPN